MYSMDKLNDLYSDLNEEVDTSNLANKKVKVTKIQNDEDVMYDLAKGQGEEINLKLKHNIKISKSNTINFDPLYNSTTEDDIDISNSPSELEYYNNTVKNFYKKQKKLYELWEKEETKKTEINETIISKPKEKKTNTPKSISPSPFRRGVRGEGWDELRIKGEGWEGLKVRVAYIWLFLILLLFLALGAKLTIEKCVTYWYENILALKNDFKDLDKAKSNISKARMEFLLAKVLITPISFIPNDNVQNVTHLISWGNELSKLLVKALELYEETSDSFHLEWWALEVQFTKILEEIKDNYEEIYKLLYAWLLNFNQIWDLWDEDLNAKMKFVKEKLFLALTFAEIINNNYETLLSILWHNTHRNYLVIFQNNDEIRPTWWFMWSTAMLTLSNWRIVNIESSDIYALEWLINKTYINKETAPEWLNKITKTFGLRDANYYPEFKDSSKKIKEFLDMIENYHVDWLIYINQNIILDLLQKIWWVESQILEETITADNFSLVLSTLVEAKVYKEWTLWTPKQILFDFGNEMYSKLLAEKKYYDYANILLKSFLNRDIVFYSFNAPENSLLWKLWINWETNFNERLDFNYPVYTSIGWNKTDRYIEYRYDKLVARDPNSCDYFTTLEIYKSQLFSKFEDEKVNALLDKHWITNKTDILNIQWRGDNKSYVRVLLPRYAIVEPKQNQMVFEFNNYKIVELYITTQKLETSKNVIEYTIPNPNCADYSYKFFKQPWIKKYNINFDVMWEKDKFTWIESDFIYKRDEGK